MRKIEGEYPVEYWPKASYKARIEELNGELVVLDEKFRWLITREDGTEYILRPEPEEEV